MKTREADLYDRERFERERYERGIEHFRAVRKDRKLFEAMCERVKFRDKADPKRVVLRAAKTSAKNRKAPVSLAPVKFGDDK